jgi:hypothetical protein
MITQAQFNQRTAALYSAMRNRFRAKYWKSGKRAGMVRVPGRELPFTKHEFRQWVMEEIGYQANPCPYCGAPIDVFSMSLDHCLPVSRGGDLGLLNLQAICAECNRMKGSLTVAEFQSLLGWMNTLCPPAQRDIRKRLMAGGIGLRKGFFERRK